MTSKKPIRFGLVGIGGYAATYVKAIEALEQEGMAAFGSVVIRTRGKYPEKEQELVARGVTIRASLEEMLEKDRDRIDIVAIPTGIDAHRTQMIQAVEAGFNVVLEKPTTGTIQDLDAMSEALRRTGKFCAIGFQSQYSPSVMGLKREICAGRLGAVREVIVKGFWMRDDHYYARNAWAGNLKAGDAWVLDGTINNPQAHYLFNGLYFASSTWGQAAMPQTVRAELYHAHDIESENTSCLEIACDTGAKVYFYGTLAAGANQPIHIEVVGEKGRAVWTGKQTVQIWDGDQPPVMLDVPAVDDRANVFRNVVRYMRGDDAELLCPLAMTRAHVLAVNGAFLSAGRPKAVPRPALWITQEQKPKPHVRTVIAGIESMLERCSADRKLLSDVSVAWAAPSRAVDVSALKTFDLA